MPEMILKLQEWLKSKMRNRGERGIALVEAIVAVGILGGGVLTMVMSMSGGAMAVQENDQEVTAQSLARTQMEYIKDYAYDPDAATYPTVNAPADYGISVSVTAVPNTNMNIKKVTANITREGSVVLSVQDYKVNR